MVKKLLKFFAYTLFFILALMVFMPKSSVYYFLEQNIKQYDIIISKESLETSILSLKVQNLELSAKEIETALIEEADITLLFFYNTLCFKNITLSSLVEVYLPAKIETLNLSYTLFNPLVINLQGSGEFGEVDGELHILQRSLTLSLQPANIMLKKYKKSIKMFKKSENGEYLYAKTF